MRLTPKLKGAAVVSWQMTCRHPGHVPCNRSRNIASCSSEEECLRMLKQWALSGLECATKLEHKDAWQRVENMLRDGTLPSTADLDARAISDVAQY